MNNDSTQVPGIRWADPIVGSDERAAVLEVLKSGQLTQGWRVESFERLMADYLGVNFAVAVSSGTSALELLLSELRIGPGDEVIVPSMTYFATASAVSRVGATPVFVDIDRGTFNLDPKKISSSVGPKTRAIIYVDFGGIPAHHDALAEQARLNDLILIQDAAQSLGAAYDGRPVGADAPMSVMSFHMAKLVTTVEGGMIFTRDATQARNLRHLRSHGEIERGIHSLIGSNCRMTEIQAAIGMVQLRKIEEFRRGREELANYYFSRLSALPGIMVVSPGVPKAQPGHFLFRILAENRDEICRSLDANSIEYRITYPFPVYQQPAYKLGNVPHRITASPISEWFASRVIALPMSSRMEKEKRELICDTIAQSVRF